MLKMVVAMLEQAQTRAWRPLFRWIDLSTDISQLLSCCRPTTQSQGTGDHVHLSDLCSLHSGPGRHSFLRYVTFSFAIACCYPVSSIDYIWEALMHFLSILCSLYLITWQSSFLWDSKLHRPLWSLQIYRKVANLDVLWILKCVGNDIRTEHKLFRKRVYIAILIHFEYI